MKKNEKILYHYCSVETFFNIIKNSCLWLSDIEKSNDYQECIQMYFDLLAEKTRYLEESPKGVSEMCKVMEDLRNESYAEGREEQAKATAIRLKQKGLPIEDIADSIGFSIETVKNWLTPKAV